MHASVARSGCLHPGYRNPSSLSCSLGHAAPSSPMLRPHPVLASACGAALGPRCSQKAASRAGLRRTPPPLRASVGGRAPCPPRARFATAHRRPCPAGRRGPPSSPRPRPLTWAGSPPPPPASSLRAHLLLSTSAPPPRLVPSPSAYAGDRGLQRPQGQRPRRSCGRSPAYCSLGRLCVFVRPADLCPRIPGSWVPRKTRPESSSRAKVREAVGGLNSPLLQIHPFHPRSPFRWQLPCPSSAPQSGAARQPCRHVQRVLLQASAQSMP
mmetsp:Transcript_43078/g.80751  ORF Transcript_43078/g.80751 Transcript_43078/m.80751 type:complete len:268 (-) Transcript_43078:412-1215(-)